MAERPIRICLISTEFPGFGPYGGFGVLTRDIALGLASRGLEVVISMPRNGQQRPVETVDGLTVISAPISTYVGLRRSKPYLGVYRMIDADIYHSEEPSIGTALAKIAMPDRKHLVTFQDPRDLDDWRKEIAPRTRGWLEEKKFWLRYYLQTGWAARQAHHRFTQAKFVAEKSRRLYGLSEVPEFLPNPLRIVQAKRPKETRPTVCYLGRWDARKRPELYMELFSRFPEVHFIFAGACLNDPKRDAELRDRCKQLSNVETPGWVNADQRADILARSWVMVNTSTRECLPVSYLEAASYNCAILAHENADSFPEAFGYWAKRGDLEDYAAGLRYLLQDDRWRALGQLGSEYVKSTHEYEKVIDQHVAVYRRVLAAG
jgi:glycosyltransferase involved in cell wall biosynthesis